MSSAIKVMISGLPGRMATAFAEAAQRDERIQLISYAFTGEYVQDDHIDINGQRIVLIRPSERKAGEYMFSMIPGFRETIFVDFTEPASVMENVDFYLRHGLYFVLGTTGGDREKIGQEVSESDVSAVVAPNMAIPIVVLTETMKRMAEEFPGSLKGFRFLGTESHQKTKKDTSGTMRDIIPSFRKLGTEASEEGINPIRDEEDQLELGVPAEFLGAHAYHDYELSLEEAGITIYFGHNVDGRDVYARGTAEAVVFLSRKKENGFTAKVYNMLDVIKDL